MSSAEDRDIIAHARERNAAVVTLDADFHALLAVSRGMRPSVIRLRLQGLDGQGVSRQVREVLVRFREQLEGGCLITVKARKTT